MTCWGWRQTCQRRIIRYFSALINVPIMPSVGASVQHRVLAKSRSSQPSVGQAKRCGQCGRLAAPNLTSAIFRKQAAALAARKSMPCKGFTCAAALISTAPILVSSPVFAFQICRHSLAFEPETVAARAVNFAVLPKYAGNPQSDLIYWLECVRKSVKRFSDKAHDKTNA